MDKHEPWCDSVTKLLLSMPPQIPPCNCKPKREWIGLTVNEARKFYEKYTNREELIYAIDKFLEEKNT